MEPWLGSGAAIVSDAPHVGFPSSVGRPHVLGAEVGMDQKGSSVGEEAQGSVVAASIWWRMPRRWWVADRTMEDGLEAFFATICLGPLLLTKLFMYALKKSNGRVICVSSIVRWEGSYDFEKVTKKTSAQSYATSKMMMRMLMAFELSLGLSAVV